MREIQWLNEREFTVGDVHFECALDDYSRKTSADRLILLKDRESLRTYRDVFAQLAPKNVLEFGIFQGGSPTLFSLWFDLEKFVGVDLCPPVAPFDEFCRTHEIGRKIRSYYGVSQTDRQRIEDIVRTEFGHIPIDAIIDDASHLYATTRRTFEIAFPLLRPGGIYVIEDWGWAHWPGSKSFIGETALSMLVMELIMLCASRSDLVSEVRVFHSFVFVRKSAEATLIENFKLDDSYCRREIELAGTQNLNLRGMARLIARHVVQRARRRLSRTAQKLRNAMGWRRAGR